MFSPNDITMSNSSTSSFGDFGNFGFSPLGGASTTAGDLEDLFGGQFSDMVPFSPFADSLSPVSHPSSSKPSPPSRQEMGASPTEKYHDSSGCPNSKEEMAQMITAEGKSTFAPSSNQSHQMNSQPSLLMFEGEHGELKFSGPDLPRIEKSDSHMDASSAWKSVSAHPQFQDCDISGLCQEFAAKARCDGTRAVLDRDGIQELVDSIPSRAMAHQNGI